MALGMTVGALLDEVSSAELTEWLAFGEFEAEQAEQKPATGKTW